MFDPSNYDIAIRDARKHALTEYPNESCGAIVECGIYIPFNNVSKTPNISFNCNDERAALMIKGVKIIALVHSHPYTKNQYCADIPKDFGPSKKDMVQQLADGYPWGIIATNGEITCSPVFWGEDIKEVAIFDREFRHGPTGTDGKGDCYALIKDYYKQELGIVLPEGPRNYDWWNDDENLYLENMERAGFRNISPQEAKPGDVFFAQLLSGVPNHGGVLLEGGLIAHHLAGRISCKDSLPRWRKHIIRWIRHDELDKRHGAKS